MAILSESQKAAFWRDGVLTVEDALTPAQLAGLEADFAGWVESSRAHDAPYGDTVDGRPRFDLRPGTRPPSLLCGGCKRRVRYQLRTSVIPPQSSSSRKWNFLVS